MKYKLSETSRFRKDVKLLLKRGYDISKLKQVIALLLTGSPLPEKYRDHRLIGDKRGTRECHIEPDWLLVYQIQKDVLVLVVVATGTHSDLFR